MAGPIRSVPAFPLQWPRGVPRNWPDKVQRSSFGKVEWDKELRALHRELKLLGASYVTISTNQELRQDGKPYAQQKRMNDAGVAVYFTLLGEQICFPCDRWTTMGDNLRAIAKHIDSIRGQARWGVGTAKQAFAGYKALTAVAGADEDWWTVLGVPENATIEAIKQAHRLAAQAAHPDLGGSADQMSRINTARDRALAAKHG